MVLKVHYLGLDRQAQQEKSSIQADGKDADIIEEGEEEFLNLDDVQGMHLLLKLQSYI